MKRESQADDPEPASDWAHDERACVSPPRVTPELVRALGEGEVLVFDGVLGAARAREVAECLRARRSELTPAAIGRGGGAQLDERVRGDLTCWLERPQVEPLASLWRMWDELARELRELAWLGVHEMEVQLAMYPGDGARYVAHRDAFAHRGRRRATAVYYLNAAWKPGDGGELRVRTASGVRDLEPRLDRLVVYLAELVEHEVLPTRTERWAVTAWLLGPDEVVPGV